MKLFKLSFLLLLCSITACSDDDPSPSSAELAGNWSVTAIQYEGQSVTTLNGEESVSEFTGEGFDMDYVLRLDGESHPYTSTGDYSIHITTKVNGQTYEQDWTNQGFLDEGTWQKEDNKILVTDSNGEEHESTILELTANTLILGNTIQETSQQNGATTTTNMESTLTFARE